MLSAMARPSKPDRPLLPEDGGSVRLAELQRFGVLDTPAEPVFDDLARLAAQICNAPMALISLVDRTRDTGSNPPWAWT